MSKTSPYSPEEKKVRIERHTNKRNQRNFCKKIKAVYHLTLNLSSMTTQTLEMTAKLDVILDRLSALIPTPSPSPPKPPPTTTPMSAPPPLAVSHHPELKTVAPMAPLTLLQFHSTNRHIQLSRPLPLSLCTAHRCYCHHHCMKSLTTMTLSYSVTLSSSIRFICAQFGFFSPSRLDFALSIIGDDVCRHTHHHRSHSARKTVDFNYSSLHQLDPNKPTNKATLLMFCFLHPTP
ncbi:hypothetical protein JHK85_018745 [Glycine max]|nr:hypothetical protein JHK85_018745 [Glycine max]